MNSVFRKPRWAIMWRSDNKLDGKRECFIGDGDGLLKTFRTRWQARDWRDKKYGYLRNRSDLAAEPHGWKYPKVVKVIVETRAA